MLLQAAPKDGNVSLPVQLNVTSSTVIKNTHWNEWQNHHWLQQQRTLSEEKKKKYWRKMVGLHFSYVHHISFCIEAGSAKRKAKPAILRTDVIVLSTSACLAVESNDSASPQITRSCSLPPARTSWHVGSQFAVQWDTKQHLSQNSLPLLSSFSQWFQLLQAKPKLKKVERGEKEKSQELKKACLNTEEWVIDLHTVQRIDEF